MFLDMIFLLKMHHSNLSGSRLNVRHENTSIHTGVADEKPNVVPDACGDDLHPTVFRLQKTETTRAEKG